MKKLLVVFTFILSTIVFIFDGNKTYASLEDYNIEYSNLTTDEVKYNAMNGITDLNIGNQGYSTSNDVIVSTLGDMINVEKKTYNTIEKIGKFGYLDNSESELYALYSIEEYSISKSDETWDSSNGIRAFSTIYVERTYESNPYGEYIRLLSSEGGWQVLDASLNTSNPIVTQGVSGMGSDEFLVSESISYNPYNIGAYSYTAHQWPRVLASGVSIWEMNVGESSQISVNRGNPSNSWTLNHSLRW